MPHSASPPLSPAEGAGLPDAPPKEAQESDASPSGTEPSSEDTEDAEQPQQNEMKASPAALDELFDDEDGDEFTSSGSAQQLGADMREQSYSDPGVMRAFYQRLFPYRVLFQWLNHSPTPTNDFANREFAFTLPNDAYLRYQFRKQCVAQVPSRFEIGPVYSSNPRDRKTLRRAATFRPISKELVFDIDLSDYNDIRTCCDKANICHRCWSFMRMAIKVLDSALREDFGFKHILWVYSGRRGIHAWVCDKRAREMDDSKRRAIAGYMELLKGGDGTLKKVNAKRPLHPHLDRSLLMLRGHFQDDILGDQDPWLEKEKYSHLLKLLPDQQLASALAKKWSSAPSGSSASKWADIDALASSGGASAALDPKRLLEVKQDIVLEYTYPRLDANVSKHLNHLLKAPFCVHPGTGRVCVPIDMRQVDEFDPLEVPRVTELLQQIDEWKGHGMDVDGRKKTEDYERTSLKPYVDYFRGFVSAMLKDEQGAKRRRDEEGEAMEF